MHLCECVCVCAHQRTKQVHSLQNEFLVADSRNTQILELLMCDSQQLFTAHLLLLKVLNVLLQTVIQALKRATNSNMKTSFELLEHPGSYVFTYSIIFLIYYEF